MSYELQPTVAIDIIATLPTLAILSLFTADHDLHRVRRAPLSPFFSRAGVAAARTQGMVRAKVERLCERVGGFAAGGGTATEEEKNGEKIVLDLDAAISAFQRDVSTGFVLGKSYDDLEKEDFAVGMAHFSQGLGRMWRMTKHLRWYGPLMLSIPRDWLIQYADERAAQFMRYTKSSEAETDRLLKDAAANFASSSQDSNYQPSTIVHAIVNSPDLPPSEKTLTRVFADVATVTGAGFETTAGVMRLVIYEVFSNAEILGKLRAELDDASFAAAAASASAVNGGDGGSSGSDGKKILLELRTLEKLPYLTAVLTEGMRMSPALATRAQRVAVDRDIVYEEGGSYGGDGKKDKEVWRIPAGTPVVMTTLFMHMDERLYPDPKRFDPERWLRMTPEERRWADKTFSPFSRGARICLADHFEFVSNQFIIGTKGKSVLEVLVKHRE
ncbi:cytochrome P450 [Bombardia bombarda]|uniref:Cytochrome P450 n=1 Tax=Bombardia bombarda TaxID=252184 RepID=A0AA39X140_9PEZI|nr:cytochrome P450 [Bombardia bombarda]